MAKRRPTSSAWQTPGTRTFLIQLQWFRAPRLNAAIVLARIHKVVAAARAPARVVSEQTRFAADEDDNEILTEPFTDIVIEAADAGEVWIGLRALLGDPKIGRGLRRCADIQCAPASEKPWLVPANAQLRLHHYDPDVPLDEFR